MKKITLVFLQLLLPFFVFSQSLSSINPSSANNNQVLSVTITGAGTHFTQGSTTVSFMFSQGSPTAAYSIGIQNDLSLIAKIAVPANQQTGNYTISVYNSIDGTINLTAGFHINGIVPPSLVIISPATANAGQTLDVTITGANTHFNQGSATFISFTFKQASGTTAVNSTTVISDVSIQANITVPANTYTGDYDVSINNPIDGYHALYGAFHINGIPPPSLVSISPATATNGQTLDVTITGANTHFTQVSSTSLNFSFISASGTTVVNSLSVISDISIQANITVPANTYTGDYDVTISNTIDDYQSLYGAFHVNGIPPPSLVSVSPAFANKGQTLNVTITGANTHFTQGSSTSLSFSFNSASGTTVVNSLSVISDISIQAKITVPTITNTGDYDVSIYNSKDGGLTLKNAFHVNSPTPGILVSISPAGAKPGQTLNVTIGGSGTHFKQASGTIITVDFNLNQANGTSVVNSKTIINDSSIIANITIPQNTSIGKYSASIDNKLDGKLMYDFYVYENCFSHFSTGYDKANNKFTLTLDSATSSLGANFAWDFGDGATSTNETPAHEFAKDTIYNVCLNVTTATGETCSYCHNIGKDANGQVIRAAGFSLKTVRYDGTVTSIAQVVNAAAPSMTVYPNPANDFITVTTKQIEIMRNPTIALLTIEGHLIVQQSLKQEKTVLNINSLAKGVYLIKMTSEEKTEVIKFVKE